MGQEIVKNVITIVLVVKLILKIVYPVLIILKFWMLIQALAFHVEVIAAHAI